MVAPVHAAAQRAVRGRPGTAQPLVSTFRLQAWYHFESRHGVSCVCVLTPWPLDLGHPNCGSGELQPSVLADLSMNDERRGTARTHGFRSGNAPTHPVLTPPADRCRTRSTSRHLRRYLVGPVAEPRVRPRRSVPGWKSQAPTGHYHSRLCSARATFHKLSPLSAKCGRLTARSSQQQTFFTRLCYSEEHLVPC